MKNFKKGDSIYVGANLLEKDNFKVCITDNLNRRVGNFNTSTSADFVCTRCLKYLNIYEFYLIIIQIYQQLLQNSMKNKNFTTKNIEVIVKLVIQKMRKKYEKKLKKIQIFQKKNVKNVKYYYLLIYTIKMMIIIYIVHV